MHERVEQYLHIQKDIAGLAQFKETDGYSYSILRGVGDVPLREVNIAYYEDEIAHETRSFDFEALNLPANKSDEIWYYFLESHELFIMNTSKTKILLGDRRMISLEFFNKNPQMREEIEIVKKDLV
jgi:hypothetical protein